MKEGNRRRTTVWRASRDQSTLFRFHLLPHRNLSCDLAADALRRKRWPAAVLLGDAADRHPRVPAVGRRLQAANSSREVRAKIPVLTSGRATARGRTARGG